MQIIDLMKFSAMILETLSKNGIKTSDYKFISLYNDYLNMCNIGEKTTYIVAHLAQKYDTSESTVYRIIRRFRRAIKL